MSYIDNHLLPGEEVRYRAHLHPITMSGPYTLGAILLGGSVATGFFAPNPYLAIIPAVLAVVTFIWANIARQTSEFAVTNKRVVIKVGWIRRHTLETMLNKVEGIGVEQTFMGRMMGCGTIVVTGTGGTREEFHNIADPLEFRRQVQAQVSEAEERRGYIAGDAAQLSAPRQERECPYCAELILAKAKVCKHCGREVEPIVSA
jgi:uncharacterized membrane protein YdbT with pleckstrin-like domain